VAPDSFLVVMETSKGTATIAVHRDWAPHGVDHLHALLQQPFYDEARFFRIVPHFIVQFGLPADPQRFGRLADASIPDDPGRASNARGTVTFASAGPGSRTSQLFINLKDNPQLDGTYPPVGVLVTGIELLDSLNAEYGEAPDQNSIRLLGNTYLLSGYPRLDYVRTMRITREWVRPGP
jgi:peptidyl-prolyl cis-trans isomerase A (cyclophilin A)